MKICIVGAGYVGFSLSVLLSEKNDIVVYDIDKEKVDMINNNISPIEDEDIYYYLNNKKLNLKATCNYQIAFENSKYIIICTPTNFDCKTNSFDTSSIEDVITKIKNVNNDAVIIIKSTVPIGYTKKIKNRYGMNIIFSPEFLREGKSLQDNLYPSRIIVGSKSSDGEKFAEILKNSSENSNVNILYMDSDEAESVKLFSNTYLAMRVAFFNELDTFALDKGYSSKDIINGVSMDPRIGDYYNNPSFGYGGYCLPKDSKQLYSNFQNIPENLIEAIINSNDTRKEYIANYIKNKKPATVGVYRLTMKSNSDNFRESSIIDIIHKLRNDGINVVIYEPKINDSTYIECKIINDLSKFVDMSSIILANRIDKNIENNKNVFTRDIFNNN